MLKKIKIKDFRSHENVELEFHPGVNVIYGLGQSGKTNILRAINWVVNNRPSGFNMHSHFSDDDSTMVELILDNGIVKLTKTSKLTTYLLNRDAKFSYTGKSVPEPITQLLNINEINISNQLDAPFLITDSPGEVGKVINRITKIEQVDNWIGRLTTLSNTSKSQIASLESDIQTLNSDLLKYEGLDEFELMIKFLDKVERVMERKRISLEDVKLKLNKWNDLQDYIGKLDIEAIDSLFLNLTVIRTKLELSNSEITPLKDKVESAKELTIKIETLKRLLHNADKDLKELDSLEFKIQALKADKDILLEYVLRQKEVNAINKNLNRRKKEYFGLLTQLKTCPICGNNLTKDHLKDLEKAL